MKRTILIAVIIAVTFAVGFCAGVAYTEQARRNTRQDHEAAAILAINRLLHDDGYKIYFRQTAAALSLVHPHLGRRAPNAITNRMLALVK
jgi:4-hydroxy-3-methylbut-2-enyl diphosphate reductase IspH